MVRKSPPPPSPEEKDKKTEIEKYREMIYGVNGEYHTKVINLVTYALLQIVCDLTAFQMMLRYFISECFGTTGDLNMDQELVPTKENLTKYGTLFFLTFTGSVVATHDNPLGAFILAISQCLTMIIVFFNHSVPKIVQTFEEYWEDENNFDMENNWYYGIRNGFLCGCQCIAYFFPVICIVWWFYCTVSIGLEVLNRRFLRPYGFTRVPTTEPATTEEAETKETEEAEIEEMKTPEPETVSTLSVSDQSTPAETDYFSDMSNN